MAPKIIYACEHCGQPRDRLRNRYCSSKCYGAAKTKAQCFCTHCGSPCHRNARYFCSKACETAATRERGAIAKRFWAKVEKSDGCWLWSAARLTANGYGISSIRGRSVVAHRIAWELATGEAPPADLDVCHKCDVRNCVRPDHLFLGTRRENVQDMIEKGRGRWANGENSSARLHPESRPRGERFPQAKLTAEVVRVIRAEHDAGTTQTALAARFAVSTHTVSEIVRRKAWRHVD